MKRAICWLVSSIFVCAASQALAQVLEEIVVTAQKREQLISDVGISVTAFTGKQLQALGITSTLDLDNQTPGLIVTGFGGGATTVFSIRGAGQLDFNDQQEAPVAVYVDGAYISWLSGVGFNFFDLERVEVLRGSQGTLFGRNATAGLVHVISAKPTDAPTGYVEVEVGDFDEVRAEGAVSGPLGNVLKGRLSLRYENNDGYVEELTGKRNHHDIDNNSGRAQLLFEPSDTASVLLAGRWSIDRANSEAFHMRPVAINPEGLYVLADPVTHFNYCSDNFPNGTPVLGATNCYGYTDNDPFSVRRDYDTRSNRDYYGATATINVKTSVGTLTSITDWQDLQKRYNGDSDTSPADLFHFFQDMDGSQLSEELRFAVDADRSKWLFGAYYLNIETAGRAGVDAIGALGVGIDNLFDLETTSYAIFSQFEHNFSSSVTGIAGVRWTDDKKEYSLTPRCTFLPDLAGVNTADCGIFAPLVQGSALPHFEQSESDWSGHIELDWRPNDDLLVYGKMARGHKAGGINGGIVSFFLMDELTYGAETPLTYESGLKTAFREGKARLNVSAFYTDYQNFQTFTSRPNIGLVIFNNDATVLGSEIELILNPADGLDLMFGVALLDAEAKDLLGAGGQYDREMANAPDVTLNGLGRYEWEAWNGHLAAELDVSYVGDRALEAENHPALNGDDYTVANASLAWTAPNDKLSLRAWVKNFTDETYFPTSFSHATITGMTQHFTAPPRWWGLTATYRW